MTTEIKQDEPAATRRAKRLAYTTWIEATCAEDPGARAALRSGVRRGLDEVPRMHRIVARKLPWPEGRGLSDTEQRAYYTVAAMIAAQPRSRYTPTADPDTEPDTDLDAEPDVDGKAAESDPAAPTATAAKSPRGDRYGTSLGAAFAVAVTEGPSREREMRDSTAERRLNLLTRQSVNGLHRHLPAGVRYLRDLDVPVDWAQLLDDLIAWPVHSGRISRRWLQDYYRLRAKTEWDKAAELDRDEILEPGPEQ